MVLVASSLVGAANLNIEVAETTSNIEISAVPSTHRQAAARGSRGRFGDIPYPVHNYINKARQLVTNQDISSEEAGREVVQGDPITKRANVYLPPGYNANDKDTKYNVLYLLHGVGGNRYEWLYGSGQVDDNFVILNIFDNLIANGEIEPMIIVFPDGRSAHDWESTDFASNETNVLGFYYFDYELRYDLIPFIESTYNTYANIEDDSPEGIAYNRKHRAIAGLSMGGMQSLNLTFGGYRFDSERYTNTAGGVGNGLAQTVATPGMQDLFAYVGAFSNAPTSSNGLVLGSGIASSDYDIDLLYITCGDADGIAMSSYRSSVNRLRTSAGDNLKDYFQVILRGAGHDFSVWNHGAYNFGRLIFENDAAANRPVVLKDDSRDLISFIETGEYKGGIYLSDFDPVSSTNGWGPIEFDMSNGEMEAGDGGIITINGIQYDKGLGVHAPSEVIYDIGGKFETFIADVGIDDEVGYEGSVTFEIWGDGVKLWESDVMLGTTPPESVTVDVSGVEILSLVVTDANDGDAYDHGNWAGARLLP